MSPSTEHSDLPSSLAFHLFHGVTNAAEIRKIIFSSKVPICLLNPQLIWNQFHLKAAVLKAVQNQEDGTMKTRTFATEILYWMSPSSNISESLKNFGAGDEAKEFLVISEESDFLQIKDTIAGTEIPLEGLLKLRDDKRIFEFYGVDQAGELYKTSDELLSGYIVSRMMCKELL